MSTTHTHNATQQVFDRVLARPVAAPDLQHGRLVHLMWHAPGQAQRLVQFYLNGRLSGASRSVTARDAWLMVDHDQHVQIELLAVCPASVSVDLSGLLAGVNPTSQPAASFSLLRDVSLPTGARVSVVDDAAGLNEQVALFEPGDPRGGFGAVFGQGGFGYDASTGPGLGLGGLGFGPLGSDGEALHWRSDRLAPGTNSITLSIDSPASPPLDAVLSLPIDRLPLPPSNVQFNDGLELTWT